LHGCIPNPELWGYEAVIYRAYCERGLDESGNTNYPTSSRISWQADKNGTEFSCDTYRSITTIARASKASHLPANTSKKKAPAEVPTNNA
jgi:hypothetical protein